MSYNKKSAREYYKENRIHILKRERERTLCRSNDQKDSDKKYQHDYYERTKECKRQYQEIHYSAIRKQKADERSLKKLSQIINNMNYKIISQQKREENLRKRLRKSEMKLQNKRKAKLTKSTNPPSVVDKIAIQFD